MARIRTVKPEFWTDETMAEISRDARLLFLALLNYVDDEGRGVDNPRLVKAAAFPLDDDVTPEMVRRWLDELSARARVVLYEGSGKRFLWVVNFVKHQKIDRKTKSRLPAPEDCNIADHSVLDEDSTSARPPIGDPSLQDMDLGAGSRDGRGDLIAGAAELLLARRDLTDKNRSYINAARKGIISDLTEWASTRRLDDYTHQRIADEFEPSTSGGVLREIDGVICRHVPGTGFVPYTPAASDDAWLEEEVNA